MPDTECVLREHGRADTVAAVQRAISEYRTQLYEEIIKRKKALRKQQRDAQAVPPQQAMPQDANAAQYAAFSSQPQQHVNPQQRTYSSSQVQQQQRYAQYQQQQQQQHAAALASQQQQAQLAAQQHAATLAAQQQMQHAHTRGHASRGSRTGSSNGSGAVAAANGYARYNSRDARHAGQYYHAQQNERSSAYGQQQSAAGRQYAGEDVLMHGQDLSQQQPQAMGYSDMPRTRSRQADPRQQYGHALPAEQHNKQWSMREQGEQLEVLNQQFQAGVAVEQYR
jgi:hypothetical protein